MILLPKIMVAPNGARKGKADHPQLPVTIPEIVTTARECQEAGAGGIHLHVRDTQGEHTLDAGLYCEAIAELKREVPDMFVQITTEAVGRYSPAQQRQVVKDVLPQSVSISISEMLTGNDHSAVIDFYHWCDESGIAVQHILYNHIDLALLNDLLTSYTPSQPLQLLFVLGRYSKNQESRPSDLLIFTDWLVKENITADWAVCAFGASETDCLLAAHLAGGKVRVGFENSLWNADGTMATSNAERVEEVARYMNMQLAGDAFLEG